MAKKVVTGMYSRGYIEIREVLGIERLLGMKKLKEMFIEWALRIDWLNSFWSVVHVS